MDLDPFDPNTWALQAAHEYRIYGDDREGVWAIVDEIDYHWAVQWRWSTKVSRGGKKKYLFRPTSIPGVSSQNVRQSIYLHVAIMERAQPEKPSPSHTISDHRDGQSLNCRRMNLRWATRSMNQRNIHGRYGHDLIEG